MNSNILSIIAFLGVASAAPHMQTRSTIAAYEQFGLTALRSGAAVHQQPFQAYNGGILAGSAAQNASCDLGVDSAIAAFYLSDDGSMNLYSTDAPTQTTFVDASGMGQGVFQFTTGAQPMSNNGQRSNFTLDASNDLTFNGAGFLACPYLSNSWSIWVDTGAANPAGHTDCVGIVVRATKLDNAVSCQYTSSS
ncbi:hypothetical protein N0V93_007910 [Gnomoniopsis smithogilvyi]|uniref:Cell wall protein PhiA n=1 Tax=Gnomoniopsis smithogilvyi TaxID=1191159 RepID=A0A9W8YM78_9PEZI|nr:hypothetical protein N0V93_007910 [Gnomoniopsis smithogilvyi]